VLAELRPRPDQVERIDIATYRFASVMRNPDPPNYFASKYSLPHAAAVMVVRGHAGFAALDDSALGDPVIAGLRHRVQITGGPALANCVNCGVGGAGFRANFGRDDPLGAGPAPRPSPRQRGEGGTRAKRGRVRGAPREPTWPEFCA